MPTEPEYTLQELATIAGVTPRTVRYYISVGLLPSPGQVGSGTRYGDDVLQRVRLIRRLQDQHLPLAEIRSRIEGMDDDASRRRPRRWPTRPRTSAPPSTTSAP